MTQSRKYLTAKVLDDAANLIEATGWCRGSYADGDRHCTIGAILTVAQYDPYYDVYNAACDAVRDEILATGFPIPTGGAAIVPTWNDAQRDRRKVVRLLRRAARKVRRGEITVR